MHKNRVCFCVGSWSAALPFSSVQSSCLLWNNARISLFIHLLTRRWKSVSCCIYSAVHCFYFNHIAEHLEKTDSLFLQGSNITKVHVLYYKTVSKLPLKPPPSAAPTLLSYINSHFQSVVSSTGVRFKLELWLPQKISGVINYLGSTARRSISLQSYSI